MALSISNLISNVVMLKAAREVRDAIKRHAVQTKSKRIPRSIKIGRVNATPNEKAVNVLLDRSVAPHALVFEKGAEPHDIDAVNAPYLAFMGTHEWAGELILTPHVDHPGMEARPYVKPGVASVRKKVIQDMRATIRDNARKNIKRFVI